jgi:hypothetical protein
MKLQFDEHYLFLMSDIQNVFNLSNTYTEQQHLLQQMSYYWRHYYLYTDGSLPDSCLFSVG